MIKTQFYEKPPITEAIIDIRVVPCLDLKLEDLRQLSDDVRGDFPIVEPMFEATGKFQIQPGMSAVASASQVESGFRLTSSDRKTICQQQFNGFTFSRIEPYEGWESFRNHARSIWMAYRKKAKPQNVSRLAVRYLNRIDLPVATAELKDYFRTSPEISPDLPQTMSGFFLQVRLPQLDIGATAIINQTIVPSSETSVTSIVLDIDVFQDESVPNDNEAVWDFFETLHDRKNEIFEACITDTTRELFK